MTHKLVEVANPLEPKAITIKCTICGNTVSFAKEDEGTPYFTTDGKIMAISHKEDAPPYEINPDHYFGACK